MNEIKSIIELWYFHREQMSSMCKFIRYAYPGTKGKKDTRNRILSVPLSGKLLKTWLYLHKSVSGLRENYTSMQRIQERK